MPKSTIRRMPAARPVREQVSAAEWRLRCELAAAHRLVAHFVSVDLTYNHISARVPDEPRHFLVKAETVFMQQVTASNLVKYDLDGKQVMASDYKASPAAYNVHAAVLKARPDIVAAVHTHSPAARNSSCRRRRCAGSARRNSGAPESTTRRAVTGLPAWLWRRRCFPITSLERRDW